MATDNVAMAKYAEAAMQPTKPQPVPAPDNRVTGGAQPIGATQAVNGNLSSGETYAVPLEPTAYKRWTQRRPT